MEQVDYLIVTENATRGQEIITNQRKDMLKDLGYSVKIACFSNKKNSEIIYPSGLRFQLTRHAKTYHHIKTAIKYRNRLLDYLGQVNPSAIEFFCPETLLLQKIKSLNNSKIVASFDQPFGVKKFIGSKLLSYLESQKFHHVDLIISLTEFGKQFLINKYGIENAKIVHIPTAFNKSEIYEPDFSDGDFAISYCPSIMAWRKGLDILVKAWRGIHKDKKLIVTGIDELNAMHFLRKEGLEIPGNIEFVGMLNREKYLKILASSSYFISSSRWEDYGLAVVEALACGKVVISTPTPGPSELLRKIDQRLISPTFSPFELSNTIELYEKQIEKQEVQKRIRDIIEEYEYSAVRKEFKAKVIKKLF
jgi:glycosyltransferase involved in cell wall biosynthesis